MVHFNSSSLKIGEIIPNKQPVTMPGYELKPPILPAWYKEQLRLEGACKEGKKDDGYDKVRAKYPHPYDLQKELIRFEKEQTRFDPPTPPEKPYIPKEAPSTNKTGIEYAHPADNREHDVVNEMHRINDAIKRGEAPFRTSSNTPKPELVLPKPEPAAANSSSSNNKAANGTEPAAANATQPAAAPAAAPEAPKQEGELKGPYPNNQEAAKFVPPELAGTVLEGRTADPEFEKKKENPSGDVHDDHDTSRDRR